MERRQLEYFVAIVEHDGFTSAAKALHVAQPSLSRAIGKLEHELGVTLFHRVGRHAVLSTAGEALADRAGADVYRLDPPERLPQWLVHRSGPVTAAMGAFIDTTLEARDQPTSRRSRSASVSWRTSTRAAPSATAPASRRGDDTRGPRS